MTFNDDHKNINGSRRIKLVSKLVRHVKCFHAVSIFIQMFLPGNYRFMLPRLWLRVSQNLIMECKETMGNALLFVCTPRDVVGNNILSMKVHWWGGILRIWGCHPTKNLRKRILIYCVTELCWTLTISVLYDTYLLFCFILASIIFFIM